MARQFPPQDVKRAGAALAVERSPSLLVKTRNGSGAMKV
jgi:hypothetical protein